MKKSEKEKVTQEIELLGEKILTDIKTASELLTRAKKNIETLKETGKDAMCVRGFLELNHLCEGVSENALRQVLYQEGQASKVFFYSRSKNLTIQQA